MSNTTGLWPLLFDLFDKLSQHLPRPRPAPVVLGHRCKARLVDVDDDDIRVGLGHDDAVTHHHVERGLLHVGGEVQIQRVGRDQEGENSGQIEIETALHFFASKAERRLWALLNRWEKESIRFMSCGTNQEASLCPIASA